MPEKAYLAIDLGASGGRLFAGLFDGERLRIEELHRFEHGAIQLGKALQWNVLGLWQQMVEGLRLARLKLGDRIQSVGVDTWGVDFALLGRNDELLGNPYSYRDRRTDGVMQRVFDQVGRKTVFDATGVQFMPINTLYQLVAMREQDSPLLDAAQTFLMMPDFQCFDPTAHNWAKGLLEKLAVPTDIFPRLVEPGTALGALRPELARETGLSSMRVIAPGTHDTASAVISVPVTSKPGPRPDWCYLSSGTWSLMGLELPEPVITEQTLRLNFTNEGGVGGTIRLLKNITGLWLVQECRRTWTQAGVKHSWDALARMADDAPRLASFINPDAPEFQAPCDMPEAIRDYCRNTKQPVPEDEGSIIRVCLDSIALRSRYVLGALEEINGGRIETVHVVGGGTNNRQLCQATADACQRTVVAGPAEATVIGNILVQAISDGAIGSIGEARDLVHRSFPVETYEPRDNQSWVAAYERFVTL
jgi:rhamnulokinase